MDTAKLRNLICLVFIFGAGMSALAAINTVPLLTNSPYMNGINDACGGCSGGKTCVDGNCVNPGVANGSPCTQGSDCQSGHCDSIVAHVCTDGANGAYCAHGSDCQSGFCSEGAGQICTDGSNNSACQYSADCQSGYCSGWPSYHCTDGSNGSNCL